MNTKATKIGWHMRVGNDGYGSEETDTISLEQLPQSFDIESTLEMAARTGSDPYSNLPPPVRVREPRRTPDDMRKLDEEIKQARAIKQPAAPPESRKRSRAIWSAIAGVFARWRGTVRS